MAEPATPECDAPNDGHVVMSEVGRTRGDVVVYSVERASTEPPS